LFFDQLEQHMATMKHDRDVASRVAYLASGAAVAFDIPIPQDEAPHEVHIVFPLSQGRLTMRWNGSNYDIVPTHAPQGTDYDKVMWYSAQHTTIANNNSIPLAARLQQLNGFQSNVIALRDAAHQGDVTYGFAGNVLGHIASSIETLKKQQSDVRFTASGRSLRLAQAGFFPRVVTAEEADAVRHQAQLGGSDEG